jgi:hypothetical protein
VIKPSRRGEMVWFIPQYFVVHPAVFCGSSRSIYSSIAGLRLRKRVALGRSLLFLLFFAAKTSANQELSN